MDLTSVLLFVLFLVFIWYLVGNRINRQQAYKFFACLNPFFKRELGTSAHFNTRFDIDVLDPVAPYRTANIQVMLEGREIIFLWLFNWFVLRKRDRFVLRADLVTDPVHELLVADPQLDLGKLALKNARAKGMDVERTVGPDGRVLEFAASSGAYKKLAGHLARIILQQNWSVTVVSYHKHRPHLVAVCGLQAGSILPDFFQRIRKLGFEIIK